MMRNAFFFALIRGFVDVEKVAVAAKKVNPVSDEQN